MIAHETYGGESVVVWEGITITETTELYIYQGNVTGLYYYKGDVIETFVPYPRRQGSAFIFEDDDASARCPRVVQDHLQFHRIATLPWPEKFPDLSLLNICRTSSGDVSGDGLTSHRMSTSLLVQSRRIGAGSHKQALGGRRSLRRRLFRVLGGK